VPELVRGPLVIADLGGYTRFLTGSELDHAHDILADLLGVVAEGLRPAIGVEKLEGDAVFCADATGAVGANGVLSAIESCYAAFARRRRTIGQATTCTCAACAAIPQLALKFVAHHGEFVVRDIAGSRELVGTDVIRVHRLLKNSVASQTGISAYALLTDSLVAETGVKGDALGAPHTEAYDDCGEMCAFVVDLDARWRAAEAATDVLVSEAESAVTYSGTSAASPELLWEVINEPRHQLAWKRSATSIDMDNPSGARGIGSQTHCVHGKTNIEQEIVDYKPPRHLTYDERNPLGLMRWTFTLEPTAGGTVLTLRGMLLGGTVQRLKLIVARRILDRDVGGAVKAIFPYADELASDGARASTAAAGGPVPVRP
jgi:uncharacterized protein YndB with AHSA1/START domain